MVRSLFLLVSLISLLTLSAPVSAQDYILSKGDKLSIVVFDNVDLSGEFEIDASGRINYPLVGPFAAAGKTVAILTEDLTAALDKDYLVNPQLTIEVLSYKPIFLMGQVSAPGSYPYSNGMVVREAVATAGGYTRRADPNDIVIIRQNAEGSTVEIEADENTAVMPGDTIEVFRRLF